MLAVSNVEILRFGLVVVAVGAVKLVQTSAVLSSERYKFKPVATTVDSTEIEFALTPPPLLLLKHVSRLSTERRRMNISDSRSSTAATLLTCSLNWLQRLKRSSSLNRDARRFPTT